MTTEYLPEIYLRFRDRFPQVSERVDALGAAADDGPLEERTRRLVKLGIAVGAMAEGAVRSSTRKALELGVSEAEVLQVAALTVSTCGLPAAVAAFSWVEEVLASRS